MGSSRPLRSADPSESSSAPGRPLAMPTETRCTRATCVHRCVRPWTISRQVLRQAGFELSQVVRLNTYTTDVDAFLEAGDEAGARLAEAGCRPSATLLGVARLAFPEYLVELEATAVA
jgi:hypothetical protein